MTHRDDLPSVIEATTSEPGSPPPSPTQVAALVQQRLNSKQPEEYYTDTISPEPRDTSNDRQVKYGTEYDKFVQENEIAHSHSMDADGQTYDIDSQGYIIYRAEDAEPLFDSIREELDYLLDQKTDVAVIIERIDELLFKEYFMSMLSEGFREFYVYKHSRLED